MTYAIPGDIRTNIVSSTSVGGIDSPFTRTRAVLDMMKGWEIMKAVTEKSPTGKRAARRKSFCARMKGVKGPMKDSKGRPTRKALALKRWRC